MNKEQRKEYNKQYQGKHKEQRKEYNKRYREKHKEQINKQKKEYREKNKEKTKKQAKQYHENNKEKREEYNKQYRKEHKEQRSRYQKQYREENKNNAKDYQKQYYEKNRILNELKSDTEIFNETIKICYRCKQEKSRDRKYWKRSNCSLDGIYNLCKQCCNNRSSDRLKNDINFKLRSIVSGAIRKALKRNKNSKKGLSVLQKLPYTIQQLRDHLESLWEDWMNWDNYGPIDLTRDTWQIDHKIPCSVLPYDSMDHPNFLKCWDLNNLQPMKAIDNIEKGNKIESS